MSEVKTKPGDVGKLGIVEGKLKETEAEVIEPVEEVPEEAVPKEDQAEEQK